MPTPSKLHGNTVPIFTIAPVDAAGVVGAAVSFAADLKSWDLTSADKDAGDLTFYDVANGDTKDWTLKLSTVVSFDAAALYAYLWQNPAGDVEVVLGPYGNAVPSATKPHLRFRAELPGKPNMSNEAALKKVGQLADVELAGTTDVELVEA